MMSHFKRSLGTFNILMLKSVIILQGDPEVLIVLVVTDYFTVSSP